MIFGLSWSLTMKFYFSVLFSTFCISSFANSESTLTKVLDENLPLWKWVSNSVENANNPSDIKYLFQKYPKTTNWVKESATLNALTTNNWLIESLHVEKGFFYFDGSTVCKKNDPRLSIASKQAYYCSNMNICEATSIGLLNSDPCLENELEGTDKSKVLKFKK